MHTTVHPWIYMYSTKCIEECTYASDTGLTTKKGKQFKICPCNEEESNIIFMTSYSTICHVIYRQVRNGEVLLEP